MANEITPNNVYTRTNLSTGVIPPKTTELIMKDIVDNSWVINNATLEEMDDLVKEFSYTTGAPGAYWTSETQKIQASKAVIVNATLTAHKMAVIIPASQEELNFENPDLFDKLAPRIAEAFYKKLDTAAILNEDNVFVHSIDGAARDSENVIVGSVTEDNILDLGGLVDENNELTDFIVARRTLSDLKKATDSKGNKLYDRAEKELDGVKTTALRLNGFDRGTVYAVDKSQVFIGIPKDFQYKVLTEGTISSLKNSDGSSVNLGEQDMQALRVTFYVAFMVAKKDAFAVLEATPSEPVVDPEG